MIVAAPVARRSTATVLPYRRVMRLRLIVVAMLGIAALLALSLLSMQAAAARARLAAADRRIAEAQRDYTTLATEFDIRSRPDMLMNWSDTTLALKPPHVRQYLAGLGQLQALARPVPPTNELAMR